MLMLLVVVGVLQFAGLSQAAGPIQGLVDTVVQALPLVGKAALILVVAYFAGLILSRLIAAAISGMRLDSRFAELSASEQAAAETAAAEVKPFSRAAGDIVFWLVMVAGLAGAFDALRITPISEPLHAALNRVVAVVPSLGFAALIVLAGYILGRVVRVVLHNLLDSLGFNRLVDRVGLGKLFGHTRPSAVVGILAMAFVVFQATIAGLNELGLVTLSGPLTAMMARFWLLLPSLAVSALVVVVGVFVGGLLRRAAAATLKNLGFDELAHRLGFPVLAPRVDHLEQPGELVGFLIQVAVILLATAQACDNLELDTWSHYLNGFLGYLLKHVAVAVAIVGVGVAIGNYVRELVRARSAAPRRVAEPLARRVRPLRRPGPRLHHGDPPAQRRPRVRPARLRPPLRRPVPRHGPRLRPRRPRRRRRDRPPRRRAGPAAHQAPPPRERRLPAPAPALTCPPGQPPRRAWPFGQARFARPGACGTPPDRGTLANMPAPHRPRPGLIVSVSLALGLALACGGSKPAGPGPEEKQAAAKKADDDAKEAAAMAERKAKREAEEKAKAEPSRRSPASSSACPRPSPPSCPRTPSPPARPSARPRTPSSAASATPRPSPPGTPAARTRRSR
jgi:hypothetical protein